MPKTDSFVDLSRYAPVAMRIQLFYERYPAGRIITHLKHRTPDEVVFMAEIYRESADPSPATTGWAAEREGDGDVNEVACLENTETSAIGRALANLGFTASMQRPSAEEMAKVTRARARLATSRVETADGGGAVAPLATAERTRATADLERLIGRARRFGLRPARAARWRTALATAHYSPELLARMEQQLRSWMARHSRG